MTQIETGPRFEQGKSAETGETHPDTAAATADRFLSSSKDQKTLDNDLKHNNYLTPEPSAPWRTIFEIL
jgi:streptomycin 6-kinase